MSGDGLKCEPDFTPANYLRVNSLWNDSTHAVRHKAEMQDEKCDNEPDVSVCLTRKGTKQWKLGFKARWIQWKEVQIISEFKNSFQLPFLFHSLNDEVMWRFKRVLTFWSLLIYIQMWKSKQNKIVGSQRKYRLEMTSQQGSVQLFIVTTSPVYKSTLLLSLVIKSTPIW